MSALPAEFHELSPGPLPARPSVAGAQLRAERRAEQATARRIRRHWAIAGSAILALAFGLTVGVLDVLH
jgi:hypothetical protein